MGLWSPPKRQFGLLGHGGHLQETVKNCDAHVGPCVMGALHSAVPGLVTLADCLLGWGFPRAWACYRPMPVRRDLWWALHQMANSQLCLGLMVRMVQAAPAGGTRTPCGRWSGCLASAATAGGAR